MLPNLARGESNKVWIIPSELNDALKGLGQITGNAATGAAKELTEATEGEFEAPEPVDVFAEIDAQKKIDEANSAASVQQAIAEAEALEGRRAARLATATESGNALTTGEPRPPATDPLAAPQQEPEQNPAG
jgi:hypothetical protein